MKKYLKIIESKNEKRCDTESDFWKEISIAMNGLPVIGHYMAWPGDMPGQEGCQAYELDTGYVAITSKIYGPQYFTKEAAINCSIVFKAKLFGLEIRSDSELSKRVQKVFEEDLEFEPQN